MFKRYLPFIGVFILTTFLFWVAIVLTNKSCYVLDYYGSNIQIIPFFYALFKGIVIFIAGIIIYYIVRNRVKWNRVKFKYLYWGLLPIAVFHEAISTVRHNIMFEDIEYSICSKSTYNEKRSGVTSTNLTLKEYRYLQGLRYELPDLPPSSKDITFWFYADDFVVDHDLELSFKCKTQEPIEKSEAWNVESIDSNTGIKVITYYDHDQ